MEIVGDQAEQALLLLRQKGNSRVVVGEGSPALRNADGTSTA